METHFVCDAAEEEIAKLSDIELRSLSPICPSWPAIANLNN